MPQRGKRGSIAAGGTVAAEITSRAWGLWSGGNARMSLCQGTFCPVLLLDAARVALSGAGPFINPLEGVQFQDT